MSKKHFNFAVIWSYFVISSNTVEPPLTATSLQLPLFLVQEDKKIHTLTLVYNLSTMFIFFCLQGGRCRAEVQP